MKHSKPFLWFVFLLVFLMISSILFGGAWGLTGKTQFLILGSVSLSGAIALSVIALRMAMLR
jgi:hypothetical protein